MKFQVDIQSYLSEGPPSLPETRLCAAVLARALLDACNNRGRATTQAREWINDDGEGEFTFLWYAEALCGPKGKDLVAEVRKHVEIGVAPNSPITRWSHQRLGRESVGRKKNKI